MADKKLNEVTKVTDMAYVPVIMSDGSIGQIAKADLASVVAGLMGNPMGYKGQISNANGIKETGIYDLFSNNSHESNDIPSIGYSMTLLSFRTNRQGLQLAFAYGNVGPFYRITEDVDNWVSRAWKTFSTN